MEKEDVRLFFSTFIHFKVGKMGGGCVIITICTHNSHVVLLKSFTKMLLFQSYVITCMDKNKYLAKYWKIQKELAICELLKFVI